MSLPDQSSTSAHLNGDAAVDLLHGLLDDEAVKRAQAHLRTCHACGELLRERGGALEYFRALPKPQWNNSGLVIADTLRDDPQGDVIDLDSKQRLRVVHARRWTIAGVVAVAALLLVMLIPTRRSDGLLVYWIPVENLAAWREGLQLDDTFAAGIDAYQAREAKRAVTLLRSAEVRSVDEIIRKLYIASALVMDHRDTEAKAVLSEIDLASIPQPWRNRGRWVLYVAHRNSNSNARADSVLESLVGASGEIGEIARQEHARRTR